MTDSGAWFCSSLIQQIFTECLPYVVNISDGGRRKSQGQFPGFLYVIGGTTTIRSPGAGGIAICVNRVIDF